MTEKLEYGILQVARTVHESSSEAGTHFITVTRDDVRRA